MEDRSSCSASEDAMFVRVAERGRPSCVSMAFPPAMLPRQGVAVCTLGLREETKSVFARTKETPSITACGLSRRIKVSPSPRTRLRLHCPKLTLVRPRTPFSLISQANSSLGDVSAFVFVKETACADSCYMRTEHLIASSMQHARSACHRRVRNCRKSNHLASHHTPYSQSCI